ncbi:MAG: SH3 domain-containing protein [Anaerolineales bacterium]|nr:SH3 domain-containing protein [Anaerolineales bacterium]
MRITRWLPLAAAGFFLTACALAATPEPTATHSPAPPTATDTEVPPAPTATLTPTETPLPTATPFVPFNVIIAATDAANLRAGPGFHFLILKVLKPGTQALLIGRAPGSEWYYVETKDSLRGWVFGMLLKQTGDLFHAPLVEPENASLIRGRVLDAAGTPINGIGFTVRLRTSPDSPANAVLTDSGGEFFSYLPYTGGVWTVTHNAVACDSIVWFDSTCTYYKKGYSGIVEPPARDVRLPQEGILEFTWK